MLQFDKHAAAYDAIRARIAYPESLYARLDAACLKRDAALDIGCGNGASTARLVARFAHVEGVDLGAQLIERARANVPMASFSACAAESFVPARRVDLVTCATAFYWMDRDAVLARCADWLEESGVFCAYRYDFPVVYGPARDIVERALVERWAPHRDARLVAYDDTLERIARCPWFVGAQRFVEPNILLLTADELALFFLSTSYGTRSLEASADAESWSNAFRQALRLASGGDPLRVNFDVHGFIARRAPRTSCDHDQSIGRD